MRYPGEAPLTESIFVDGQDSFMIPNNITILANHISNMKSEKGLPQRNYYGKKTTLRIDVDGYFGRPSYPLELHRLSHLDDSEVEELERILLESCDNKSCTNINN